MTTIDLHPDVAKELERLAAQQHSKPEDVVAAALRRYMRQVQEEKVKEEAAAFRAMYSELESQYEGQFVAVHEGQVVDHDEDYQALHRRIRQSFGDTAVLLRRVGVGPERVLTFRSPRLGRGEP